VELKSAVRFSKEVEGRLYTFTMPANAPVGEAYDILFEGLRKIVEIYQCPLLGGNNLYGSIKKPRRT
jgi:hypothetical protein